MTIESKKDNTPTTPAITYSECYQQPFFTFWNADSSVKIQEIKSESVDCILTDPPYKYLKNQKLEVDFDENIFFNEVKRVLKPSGFIVLFGRGISFYRWNTMLADLGFNFKEEIIWNKSMGTSPLSYLCRIHETISIWTKKNGTINKIKIPYLEAKEYDLLKIQVDINRINSALGNPQSLKYLVDFINGKRSDMELNTRFTKHKVTSDIRKSGSREVNTLASIQNGITEKSIIHIVREHYNTIHPTQKPVELYDFCFNFAKLEAGAKVLDTHLGSGSSRISANKNKLNFVGFEIDEEYFNKQNKRYADFTSQTRLF